MQGDVVYWIFMTYIHIYSPPKWLNPGYGYHGSVSTAVYSFSSGRGGRGFQGIVRCWWICATLLSFFLSLMSLSDRRMPPFFSRRGQRGFLTRIFEAETESIDNFGDNFFPASNTSELRRNVDDQFLMNSFIVSIYVFPSTNCSQRRGHDTLRWKNYPLRGFTGGCASSSYREFINSFSSLYSFLPHLRWKLGGVARGRLDENGSLLAEGKRWIWTPGYPVVNRTI